MLKKKKKLLFNVKNNSIYLKWKYFSVTFVQFNVSLLNKSINLFIYFKVLEQTFKW